MFPFYLTVLKFKLYYYLSAFVGMMSRKKEKKKRKEKRRERKEVKGGKEGLTRKAQHIKKKIIEEYLDIKGNKDVCELNLNLRKKII